MSGDLWRVLLKSGMGWDGMGWDGMGWDGMGWDGKGRDGSWDILHPETRQFAGIVATRDHEMYEATADLEITLKRSPGLQQQVYIKVVLMVTNYLSMLICM